MEAKEISIKIETKNLAVIFSLNPYHLLLLCLFVVNLVFHFLLPNTSYTTVSLCLSDIHRNSRSIRIYLHQICLLKLARFPLLRYPCTLVASCHLSRRSIVSLPTYCRFHNDFLALELFISPLLSVLSLSQPQMKFRRSYKKKRVYSPIYVCRMSSLIS